VKLTTFRLKELISQTLEEYGRLSEGERTFTGENDRWSVDWTPMEKRWELSADGEAVASGVVTHPDVFVGPKGTNLEDAIDAYQESQKEYWKYEMRPRETELPENAKEGWKIEFSSLEEEDVRNLYSAMKDVKQSMRDAWS